MKEIGNKIRKIKELFTGLYVSKIRYITTSLQ